MALYTTRQKYRRPDLRLLHGPNDDLLGAIGLYIKTHVLLPILTFLSDHKPEAEVSPEAADRLESTLSHLYGRSVNGEEIPFVEFRDALRQAAGLICSSSKPRLSVVHYLVALPFRIFTKETIKLGVSLWLGVIHENPSIEPRVLAEVVEAWERSIQCRQGLFDPEFGYVISLNPFVARLLLTDSAVLIPCTRRLNFFQQIKL